jgi:predicted dehydrogenase
MGISIGIVGLGSFGSSFVELFNTHPLVERIALCDREPDRLAAFANRPSIQNKFSPRDVYSSFDQICRSDLQALAIFTQPWLHASQAVQAMQAGKHVYSAVPVVSLPNGQEILEWCDRLIDTCTTTGQLYMLGETTFYRPETMYCRRQAEAGSFGHFVYVEGEYLHDVDWDKSNLRKVRQQRLASAAGIEWASQKSGQPDTGGAPMHYPTHSTSGPISVMGAHALEVTARGFLPLEPDDYFGEEFSNETALFHMSNGATMRICEYRQIGHPGAETLRVFGTEGTFRENSWLDKSTRTPLTVEEMRDPLPPEIEKALRTSNEGSSIYGGHGGSHAYLVHEFVDAVAKGRTPAINAWEAVRYMAAGVVAHESALRNGEMRSVPDWGDAPG